MNWNEKYTSYQKLCQIKFVDLIEAKSFVFLRFYRISHILVKKLNFRFLIVFFQIEKKNMHIMKKCRISILSIFLEYIIFYNNVFSDRRQTDDKQADKVLIHLFLSLNIVFQFCSWINGLIIVLILTSLFCYFHFLIAFN